MEADPFADTHREPANSPLRPCDRVGKIDLPLLAASPCAALAAYFLCMGLRNRVGEDFPYSPRGAHAATAANSSVRPLRIKKRTAVCGDSTLNPHLIENMIFQIALHARIHHLFSPQYSLENR